LLTEGPSLKVSQNAGALKLQFAVDVNVVVCACTNNGSKASNTKIATKKNEPFFTDEYPKQMIAEAVMLMRRYQILCEHFMTRPGKIEELWGKSRRLSTHLLVSSETGHLHDGLARLFRVLPNARGADRSHSLAPVTTAGRSLAPMEDTAASPRGSCREWGLNTAGSGRGPCYLARSKALSTGLSNAYFKSLGLPSLFGAC
jgi:hypothetical protein